MEWWLLHIMDKSTPILTVSISSALWIVTWGLDLIESLKGCFIAWADVLNLRIGNKSLLWLLALLIKDTKIKPDLWHKRVQWSSFDDILKWITEVTILVVYNCQWSPVGCLSWILECSFLEKTQCLHVIIFLHVASSLNIERISLSWIELLHSLGVFKRLLNVSSQEWAPGQVLIDLVVVLINDQSGFILLDCLVEVLLLFIQQTDLDESISLSLQGERIRQDGVLEVADCLRDLVCLCKDDAEFVENLTSLVEVGRHL